MPKPPQPTPVFGPTNPTPAETVALPARSYCSMVGLRPEAEQRYRELHGAVWPDVVAALRQAHIRNYHIYITTIGGQRCLVSHFEHTGDDLQADLAGIANDPTTRDRWWPITDLCQLRLQNTPPGEQWLPLERVMHLP
jgi:L-rhamnose mutarotase